MNDEDIDPEAVQYIFKAAEKGHVESLAICGFIYYYSQDPEDKKKAIEIFQKTADLGQIDSMFQYGLMLLKGILIPEDKQKVIVYLKNAADRCHTYAMFFYGQMLFNGDGVPVDKIKAMEYFKKINDDELSLAHLNYNSIINDLTGTETEIYKRIYNLREAGKDDAHALYLYYLASIYGFKRKDPLSKLEESACIKKAAEMGDVDAMYAYALSLYYDPIFKSNKKECAKYFKEAADKGNKKAMGKYAEMLENGDGIQKNREMALKYLTMEASQEYIDAIYNTGNKWFNKSNVKEDRKESISLIKIS